MTDSVSTEHTPPTAEEIAAKALGADPFWSYDGAPVDRAGIAQAVVQALRDAGLLPESPSAAPTTDEISTGALRRIADELHDLASLARRGYAISPDRLEALAAAVAPKGAHPNE